MTTNQIVNEVYKYNKLYASKELTKKYSKKWFKEVSNEGNLICISDDQVKAWACAYIFKDYPKIVNLSILGVNPLYLHKGYGIKVVKKFLDNFKNKLIVLNVNNTNLHAISFYKKMGFKIVKNLKNNILMKYEN
jgi:ribosomal protein S18 acetylase RimI-like enzyme